jgi:hypothetical protein
MRVCFDCSGTIDTTQDAAKKEKIKEKHSYKSLNNKSPNNYIVLTLIIK